MEDSTKKNFLLQALVEKLPCSCMLAQNVPIIYISQNSLLAEVSHDETNETTGERFILSRRERPLLAGNSQKYHVVSYIFGRYRQ